MTMTKRVIFLLVIAVFMVSSLAFAGVTMPEQLDEEFTQYPDSSIVTTTNVPGAIVQAVLDCGDASIDDVYDYYIEKAKDNGWMVQAEDKSADSYSVLLVKGTLGGNIVVALEEDMTSAVVSIMQQ